MEVDKAELLKVLQVRREYRIALELIANADLPRYGPSAAGDFQRIAGRALVDNTTAIQRLDQEVSDDN